MTSPPRRNSLVSSPTFSSSTGRYTCFWDSDRCSVQASTSASSVYSVDYTRVRYNELGRFLKDYLAKRHSDWRPGPQPKLIELSNEQFDELLNDLCDEIMDRKSREEVLFLPSKLGSRSIQTRARQQLSRMKQESLEDVAADIYFEMTERRYPYLRGETSIPVDTPLRGWDRGDKYRHASEFEVCQMQEEISQLRNRCSRLEKDNESIQKETEYLKSLYNTDVKRLHTDIRELWIMNNKLVDDKESSKIAICMLENMIQEFRKDYGQIKADLSKFKGSIPRPVDADHEDEQILFMATKPGVPDIHIQQFTSSIDNLLGTARSGQHTKVLRYAACAADAVANIIQDITAYERHSGDDMPPDIDINLPVLQSLGYSAKREMSILMDTTRHYAKSAGMSPISFLEAAARRVSDTVVEIGHAFYVPLAMRAESPLTLSSRHSRAPWTSEALGSVNASATASTSSSRNAVSNWSGGERISASRQSMSSLGDIGQNFFHFLSSNMNTGQSSRPSSLSIAVITERSTPSPEGTKSKIAVYQPYLEAQSRALAATIQNLISELYSPTTKPTVTENVARVIATGSDVIHMCKANCSPSDDINDNVKILRSHVDKLNFVWRNHEPYEEKDAWKIIVSSSFAIADAMRDMLNP